MHNSDTLQVSFSLSSREQRRAGRRMWRYRTPDLKRRYWLATLLLVVIFAALFYGFSENVRRVTNFLWDGYELFQESGQTDETLPEWGRDIWLGNTDAMAGRLQHLKYWLTGLLLLVIFYLRWSYSLTLRVILDKEFLLFYVNRNAAYFIPLDRFADHAAAAAFFQQALQFKEQS